MPAMRSVCGGACVKRGAAPSATADLRTPPSPPARARTATGALLKTTPVARCGRQLGTQAPTTAPPTAAPTAPPNATLGGCTATVMKGKDYLGHDLGSKEAASFGACCTICTEMRVCGAFTFVARAPPLPSPRRHSPRCRARHPAATLRPVFVFCCRQRSKDAAEDAPGICWLKNVWARPMRGNELCISGPRSAAGRGVPIASLSLIHRKLYRDLAPRRKVFRTRGGNQGPCVFPRSLLTFTS